MLCEWIALCVVGLYCMTDFFWKQLLGENKPDFVQQLMALQQNLLLLCSMNGTFLHSWWCLLSLKSVMLFITWSVTNHMTCRIGIFVTITDIHQRSCNALCNGFISHGAQSEVLGFLPTTTQMGKTDAFTIFVCHAVFYACLSSSSDHRTCCMVTYGPDEPQVILVTGKPKDPQLEPHARIKMMQVLGSLVYVCHHG